MSCETPSTWTRAAGRSAANNGIPLPLGGCDLRLGHLRLQHVPESPPCRVTEGHRGDEGFPRKARTANQQALHGEAWRLAVRGLCPVGTGRSSWQMVLSLPLLS